MDSNSANNQPVVSFCIPVYNKAQVTEKLIEGLLVSDDTRFEIVISDNASSDNTHEVISSIHDRRLKYYRNDTNIGAKLNWLRALERGKGEYLYLVMSRDRLHGEKIGKLISLLEYARDNNITYLYDGYCEPELDIYNKIDAMIKCLGFHHPTGTIFNMKSFSEIQNRCDYFRNSDAFPENYLRYHCILKGEGCYMKSGVFIHGDMGALIDMTTTKSSLENVSDILNTWYSPRRRTGQFFELIDMIDDTSNTLSDYERDKFFEAHFYETLRCVSLVWRNMCRDTEGQAHYNQNVRHVSLSEMLRNIFKLYRDTAIHLQEDNRYTRTRQIIMRKCRVKSIVNMFGNIFHVTARKILQPLGIWQILKHVKNLARNNRDNT